MEEAVSDAIITERCEDIVLARLIDLALVEIREMRFLFPNPLDEPVMYRRYLKPWVSAGLAEAEAIRDQIEKKK